MKFKLMGAAATAALLVAAPAAFAQQKSDEGKSGAPQAQSGPSGSSGQSSAVPSAKGEGSEQQKGQGQSKGDVTKGAQSGSKDQSGSKAKSADQGEPKGKSSAQSEPKGSKQGEPKASAQGSKEPMNKGAEQKSSKDTQQKSTKDSAQKSSKDQDRKGTAQKTDGGKQPSSSSASDSTKGAAGKDTAAGKDGRAGKDGMASKKDGSAGKDGVAFKDGGKSGSRVQVSQEQRVSIHQNILKSGRPNRVDKVNFSISVGTRVPRNIHLVALPAAVLTIVPAYRNYRYVMVHDEIVIVEPSTYEIVEVINVSSQTASHGGGGSATLVLTDEERSILMNEIDLRGSSTLGLGTLTEGADVPRSVEVRVFPETVVQKVHKLQGYKFFTAENRIAIVDPDGSKVKLVIEGRR